MGNGARSTLRPAWAAGSRLGWRNPGAGTPSQAAPPPTRAAKPSLSHPAPTYINPISHTSTKSPVHTPALPDKGGAPKRACANLQASPHPRPPGPPPRAPKPSTSSPVPTSSPLPCYNERPQMPLTVPFRAYFGGGAAGTGPLALASPGPGLLVSPRSAALLADLLAVCLEKRERSSIPGGKREKKNLTRARGGL